MGAFISVLPAGSSCSGLANWGVPLWLVALCAGLALVEKLRDELPDLAFEMNQGGGNFKAQFRRADRSGARLALILGENELERGVAAFKPLRLEAAEQAECTLAELPARIPAILNTMKG